MTIGQWEAVILLVVWSTISVAVAIDYLAERARRRRTFRHQLDHLGEAVGRARLYHHR